MDVKAEIFLNTLEALARLRLEIQSESTTNPRHVYMAKRIEEFSEELMQAAEPSKVT